MEKIIELDIKDFEKCNNIWDMKKQKKLKEKFYNELLNKERITFVYVKDEEYIGELSVVFEKHDPDYTILGKRLHRSRMIVKSELRGRGYAKKLINHVID